MPLTPSSSPHSFDPLGVREEIGKIMKNPLHTLLFFPKIGWNAISPILGMGRNKMSEALSNTTNAVGRTIWSGINGTRRSIGKVLANTPIFPLPGKSR